LFSFQGKDFSKPAGNWSQLLMVLFTKEHLPTSVLCFLVKLPFRFPAGQGSPVFVHVTVPRLGPSSVSGYKS